MGTSIYEDIEPADFSEIDSYSLNDRKSKVDLEAFASVVGAGNSVSEFLDSLPDILGAKSLKSLAQKIVEARKAGKPIIWGIGGHVIKTGLAPILIDLLERGYVSAIACNGSVLVHDSEIATVGFTSEDVDATLGSGSFGAARETGELLGEAASIAAAKDIGLGEAFCANLIEKIPAFASSSLLCAAYRNAVPVTSHVTIGADIGHFHPTVRGNDLGQGSHVDFRLFTSLVAKMNDGGVYLNCGSAVTLPEVFLKAVTINRNLGSMVSGITTANLDFIQHYRPLTNVIKRPNAGGAGQGFAITGHHEIMVPLLAAAIDSYSQ